MLECKLREISSTQITLGKKVNYRKYPPDDAWDEGTALQQIGEL